MSEVSIGSNVVVVTRSNVKFVGRLEKVTADSLKLSRGKSDESSSLNENIFKKVTLYGDSIAYVSLADEISAETNIKKDDNLPRCVYYEEFDFNRAKFHSEKNMHAKSPTNQQLTSKKSNVKKENVHNNSYKSKPDDFFS